jgi:hypothetical protein
MSGRYPSEIRTLRLFFTSNQPATQVMQWKEKGDLSWAKVDTLTDSVQSPG